MKDTDRISKLERELAEIREGFDNLNEVKAARQRREAEARSIAEAVAAREREAAERANKNSAVATWLREQQPRALYLHDLEPVPGTVFFEKAFSIGPGPVLVMRNDQVVLKPKKIVEDWKKRSIQLRKLIADGWVVERDLTETETRTFVAAYYAP